MKKGYKIAAICCFCGSAASLSVGASFHGFRMQPEKPELFNIGVTMGIVMLGISTLCIAVIIYDKKHGK